MWKEHFLNFKVSFWPIFALFTLAIAQPLYFVLTQEKSQPFFIAHNASFLNIFLLVLVWSAVLPAFICLIIFLASYVSQLVGRIFYTAALFSLFFCLYFPLCSHKVFFALVLSFMSIFFVISFSFAQKFLSFLAIAVFASAGIFLVSPNVRDRLVDQNELFSTTIEKNSKKPHIVLVVFDQIPLTTLLDENLQLNHNLFPNFARLANEGTWYKNASTLYTHTRDAIPAILVGSEVLQYRVRQSTTNEQIINRTPDQRHFPKNLFSLFASTHKMNVFESVTQLGPLQKNPDFENDNFSFKNFLSDSLVVAAYGVIGNSNIINLPPMDDRWSGFLAISAKPSNNSQFEFEGERANKVESFIKSLKLSETPTFNFLHVVLPHVPFEYDENGKLHNRTPKGNPQRIETRIGLNIWGGKEGTKKNLELHVAQTRFVDLLLGRIIDKIKQEKMFDESMIVVTADHGIDFFWDDLSLSLENVLAIKHTNMYSVPLIIKYPGQKEGKISTSLALSIDIAPTIAKVLHQTPTWVYDGISLIDEQAVARKTSNLLPKIFLSDTKAQLEKIVVRQRMAPEAVAASF